MKKFDKLIADLENAQEALEKAILDEMDRVARRHKLDKMVFGMYTALERNGKEVELKRIEELDLMYGEYVHPNGFQAIWKKEKGWC